MTTGYLSPRGIDVMIAAAKRELYRLRLAPPPGGGPTDLWTCSVGTVTVIARNLITRKFIRLAADVVWLPRLDARYRSRLTGDGMCEVWTITPIGWHATAQAMGGGAAAARTVLGPAPRDDVKGVTR